MTRAHDLAELCAHALGTLAAIRRVVQIISLPFVLALSFIAACSSPPESPLANPDAAPRVALDPRGTFLVQSTYALSAPPRELAPLLAELSAATDGVDDPSAYLVDLVVAELPEGTTHTIASALAPYVAWYVNDRIAMYAPDFMPSVRALATGAQRIATHVGTIEELRITDATKADASSSDGSSSDASATFAARARRTLLGVAFDTEQLADLDTAIAFADVGLSDPSSDVDITVEIPADASATDRFAIAPHAMAIPYAAWFRIGFDRAVIPSVVPGATDLAQALRALVHCPRFGALIADALELGSPALYAQACSIGLGVAARKIYERFPSVTDRELYKLTVGGAAHAIDRDRDGVMDAIVDGTWTGRLDDTSVGTALFEGTSR